MRPTPSLPVVCAAAVLLTPRHAAAQPGDLYLSPDFAQVREGLPDYFGVPGGGYCGPTSACDVLQWLRDHGYPDVPGVPDVNDEDVVTLFIALIGGAMGTGRDEGTSTGTMVNVLDAQLGAPYPGVFDVGFYSGISSETELDQDRGRHFDNIILLLEQGYAVITNIGWYLQEPELKFVHGFRCGGHWIVMTGYDNDGGDRTARYHDPVDGARIVATKPVSDSVFDIEVPGRGVEPHELSYWHWIRDSGNCAPPDFSRFGFQDGMIYIGGVRLFSRDGVNAGLLRAFNMAGAQTTVLNLASGPPVTTLAPRPGAFQVYHARPQDNLVFITHLQTGQITILPTMAPLNQPRRMAFGHDEVLYIGQGSSATGFSLLALAPDGSFLDAETLSGLGAIAYHEQLNRVYVWEPAAGVVRAFTLVMNTLQLSGTLPLAASPPFVAPGYMAIDDGRTPDPSDDLLYYNHAGGSAIFRLRLSSGLSLPPITAAPLADPDDMVVDNRGHLFVAQAMTAAVLEFDTGGSLVTGSPASAFTATNLLAILRAKRRPFNENYYGGFTNEDAPIDGPPIDCNMNGIPDYIDVGEGFSEDDNMNGVPDECEPPPLPGDLDGDGDVDVSDLLELLSGWGPCPTPCPPTCPGDVNDDCTVDVSDLLALLANWT
jgi:hypothetical protein